MPLCSLLHIFCKVFLQAKLTISDLGNSTLQAVPISPQLGLSEHIN